MDDKRKRRPYVLNSSGPFYVEDGECIDCGATEATAPELITHGSDYHCYFKLQPTTPEEIGKAIMAVCVSCCGVLRYAGDDSAILNRMANLDLADRCDQPITNPGPRIIRTHAAFTYKKPWSWLASPRDGKAIAAYIRQKMLNRFSRVSKPRVIGMEVAFLYKPAVGIAGTDIHSLSIILAPLPDQRSDWLLKIDGRARQDHLWMSIRIDEILKGNPDITNILWYSSADWNGSRKDGTPLPF